MNQTLTRPLLLLAATMACGVAQAAPPPNVAVYVDNVQIGAVAWLPDALVAGGYTTTQTFFVGTDVRVGEAFFAPVATPQGTGWNFSWGAGFTHSGTAAKTLKLVFDLPFAASLVGSRDLSSSLIGTVVDTGGDGVQLLAPASGYVQSITLLPGSGNNVGLSSGSSFISPASGNSGSSYGYGEFLAAATNTPSGPIGLRVVAEFSLSPGADAAALDGFVAVSPVPEPHTYALMLAGLAGIGLVLRQRSC